MKIELIVSFNGKWVLEHRNDANLPVANAVKFMNIAVPAAKVIYSDFSSVAFAADIEMSADALSDAIKNGLAELYGAAFENAGVKFEHRALSDDEYNEFVSDKSDSDEKSDADSAEQSETAEKTDPADTAAAGPSMRSISDIISSAKRRREEEEKAERERREKAAEPDGYVSVLLDGIDMLPGSREFKALCHEIVDIAPALIADKMTEVFDSRSYLFVINDGCGLEQDLSQFAALLMATGLKKLASKPIVECTLGPVKESEEPFESAARMLRMGEMSTSQQIMSIDISEWLNATDNRYFKNFLKQLAAQRAYIPVFRVPYVDKFVQDRLYKSLNDVMFVKRVVIPPYTRKELEDYAKRLFSQYGYTLNKSAWQAFFARLDDERADGRFYGLDTVRKVVMELLYDKLVFDAKSKRKSSPSKVIDGKAAAAICEGIDSSEYGMEALKKLVGSAEIEKRVNEIIAQIELAAKTGKERPCIHMQFVGNPGTGKTTVARIVGKILKERGILSVGNFFEHSGRDFCGRYIGETAPKTSGMCRDAYGSVMFIDEAYSLFRGDGNDRDFGREALDTLIAEMENHRSDFVVIMAGYTDDMKKMMEGNSGLKSRVPYTIEFPNFTREQLYEIFVSMVGKIDCDQQLLESANKYFSSIPDEVFKSKEFSNARFVRNLFERTWAKASMRCQLSGTDTVSLVCDDFDRATADGEFKFDSDNKHARIGFRV